MRNSIYLSLILTVLFFASQPSYSLASPEPEIIVLSDGLELKWQTPSFLWIEGENGLKVAQIEGYELTKTPGVYRLPFYSTLIAIPEGANPELEMVAVSTRTISFEGELDIAPRPEGVVYDNDGNAIGGDFVDVFEGGQSDLPIVDFEEMGSIRGVQLGRVTFYPFHPQGNGKVEWVESASVSIAFNAPGGDFSSNSAQPDFLIDSMANMIVNPDHIQPANPPRMTQSSLVSTQQQLSNQEVVIEVVEAGLTAVTRDNLYQAGFSLSGVDPKKLQLQHNGVVIPFEWDGDNDSQFETNERIIFYASPIFSRWSETDSYILTVESSDGARISTQASSTSGLAIGDRTATLLLEENKNYSPNCYCGILPFGRDGDRYMWDDLRQPGRPENDYSFLLPLVDSSKPAELTAWFMGFTSVTGQNPDHKVTVSLNDTVLGSTTWDARTAVTDTFSIPISTLQTSNLLNLNLPGISGVSIDGIWFDAASVEYILNSNSVGDQVAFEGELTNHKYSTMLDNLTNIRVYDVTDPTIPIKITNLSTSGQNVTFGESTAGQHRYSISNDDGLLSPTTVRLRLELLTAGEQAADYVILSHPAFISSLTRLVNWREAQGLTVVVEDVLAVYDQYGNGRQSPDAIHDYFKDAYNNWTPTYVLLVGDTTIDPKNYLNGAFTSWLLPFVDDVDPWIGEVPIDNRYVSVDGDDIIPDMIVGRLPVNSPEETTIVVNKIVDYEENPAFGMWNGYVSLVADNRDSAGDFELHSNEIIDQHLSDPYIPRPVYYKPGTNTQEEVISQINSNWALGSGMLFYNGHSSVHQWGSERFFHLDDVSSLTNSNRLPIVLQMTCLTGSFHRPEYETLDEALLRYEGGGAVAVWGATGLGVATGHEKLSDGYLTALFNNPNIGQAVIAGKINLLTYSPANDELVETFTLLGDPATIFDTDLWPGYSNYLPTINN